MTADRFVFQRQAVERALAYADSFDDPHADHAGLVLNVGALDDQAQAPHNSLKPLDPQRVINCDLSAVDEIYDDTFDPPLVIGTRPNAADVLFDAARDRWPFNDRAAVLVVLGDILEHMTPEEIRATLTEARRVSHRVCITTPEDHRDTTTNERADKFRRGHVHRTIVTRELLEGLLIETDWTVTSWDVVLYDSGQFWGLRTYGHHVQAE